MAYFEQLEKTIILKIRKIEKKETSAKDSGVAKLLNTMKEIDEPCYDTLLERYKKALGV
jgi:hypothetical protein